MISLGLVLILILLLFLFGIGPTLLLFRTPRGALRVLLLPFMGMASALLLFFALMPLNVTGNTDGGIVTITLIALAAFLLWRRRFTREEVKLSLLPLAACLISLFIACWPLFLVGYQDFMGYANPDVPFLSNYVHFFSVHPFELVHGAEGHTYRGILPQDILGAYVFFYSLAFVTSTDPAGLFAIVCAAMACLVPASAYLASQFGIGLSRRNSVALTFVAALSSVIAYTFNLHSLGTMMIIATLPVCVSLLVGYLAGEGISYAVTFALLTASQFYNYPLGCGIIVAAAGGVVIAAFIAQPSIASRIGKAVLICGIASFLPCFPYASACLLNLIQESTAKRLMSLDEIHMTFALLLTERGIPHFWGIFNPYSGAPQYLGPPHLVFAAMFLLGGTLFGIFFASLWIRGSRGPFMGAVLAMLLALAVYYARVVPYGVFKFIAWIHLSLIIATLGFVLLMAERWRHRWVSVIAWGLVAGVAGLNLATAIRLGSFSLGWNGAVLNSAPTLKLSTLAALRNVPLEGGVLSAFADPVVRQWTEPYLGEPLKSTDRYPLDNRFKYLTPLQLNVQDSTPIPLPACAPPLNCASITLPKLLTVRSDLQEITRGGGQGEWTNEAFTLQEMPPDQIVLGRGWYRPERQPTSPVKWQRNCFRFVRKRAEFFVVRPSTSPRRVHFAVAPGYGGASEQRHLRLFLNGKLLDTVTISAFQEVVTAPIVIPGPASQFEIEVEEDVKQIPRGYALWNKWVPADARQLNIAVSALEIVN